jgi:hypothetical protein
LLLLFAVDPHSLPGTWYQYNNNILYCAREANLDPVQEIYCIYILYSGVYINIHITSFYNLFSTLLSLPLSLFRPCSLQEHKQWTHRRHRRHRRCRGPTTIVRRRVVVVIVIIVILLTVNQEQRITITTI